MAVTVTINETNVNSNTATINWTGNAQNYHVRYREKTFFEDFEQIEHGSLHDGWTTIDNDGDGKTWFGNLNTNPGHFLGTHSGYGLAASESYDSNNHKVLKPDNWLITPLLDLKGTMKVWLRGQSETYSGEHFAIYLSTTGKFVDENGELEDGLVKLVDEQVTTSSHKEYTADLSSYYGQKGYIAIRHFNCTDLLVLDLDDFGIYDVWTETTVNANSYTITDLNLGTEYEVEVQAAM